MFKKIALFFAIIFAIVACNLNQTADLVIKDVKVVDVETGQVSDNKSIEIRDGHIAGVYDAETDISAEETIEGEGKYVIPGLWDMHVHFRGGDSLIAENKELLKLYIQHGVTTVRDAGGDITPAILEWKKEIEKGNLRGPRIFTSGPKLDGADPSWAGSIEVTEVSQVSGALDSLESLNVDYVKLYDSTIPGDVYIAAIKEAEERGLPVTGHMPFTVDFNDAVAAGLDATEHMYYVLKGSSTKEEEITKAVQDGEYGFWEALSEVVATYDSVRANKTYQQMADAGTGVVPTLHIGKVLAFLNEEDHSGDPFLEKIPDGIQQTYEGRLQSALRQSDGATQRRRNLRQRFVSMIPNLHEAGVSIYAGSDSGPYNSFVYPGLSLHKELEELVEAGLTPLEALQTSVQNGPAFFGVSDTYGKIQQGYAADLLILNSNPLSDIKNTQDIYSVILKGKKVVLKDSD